MGKHALLFSNESSIYHLTHSSTSRVANPTEKEEALTMVRQVDILLIAITMPANENSYAPLLEGQFEMPGWW